MREPDEIDKFEFAENQGLKKGKIEMVKRLVMKNFDNQTISEITDLSISEIEKLRTEIQK